MQGTAHIKALPARLGAAAFRVKAGLFRLDRLRRDLFDGVRGCGAVRFVEGFALTAAPVVAGADHEGADFWRGLDIERGKLGPDLFAGASAVVLPALVEHNPRALLRARAAGIPVIASRECGIPRMPGVTIVPGGDVTALSAALMAVLGGDKPTLAQAA